MSQKLRANLLALFAVVMWASLAPLGVALSHVPPFLLTGIGLLIGSSIGLLMTRGNLSAWGVPIGTLAIGVVGLFGFHFFLFMALRLAPPVEANLINYLWPLGMVLLAPLYLPNTTLTKTHLVAGFLGFSGAAIAIMGGAGVNTDAFDRNHVMGYALALCSSFVWASYSLLCKRIAHFPTSALGLFGLVSGALALICSWLFEDASLANLNKQDWALLLLIGLGALGSAFYAWDAALKMGSAQTIGVLAFSTPLLSTVILSLTEARALGWHIGIAALLIVGAAFLASKN